MAYRFKLKESLCDGVRRIAVEQIDKVLHAPRKGDDRATWVHETRKTMKRTRALLKCVRSGLDDGDFREENAALAGIARGLSNLRDRDVMAQTIASLAGNDEKLDKALDWLAKQLHAPADGPRARAPSSRSADATSRTAIKALEKVQGRLAKIEVAGELVDTVGAGLRATQRKGREAVARLAAEATDDNVHDLRKIVQVYQRQQSLVYAVWPEMQSVRIEAARALAQSLGEAQDLAVLATTAQDLAKSETADGAACGRIVDVACRAQQRLIREAAMPMAARLFAARPSAVERDLTAGWEAAVSLNAAHYPVGAGAKPATIAQKRPVRVTPQ
jgi:CHAD domain-containing protein